MDEIKKVDTQWSRVSREAKLRKSRKKMSQRDIDRELRLKELGEKPLEVTLGTPLSEEVRCKRMELEWDRMYPKRKKKKPTLTGIPKKSRVVKGAERSEKKFLYDVLTSAKTRAKANGIPFNLVASQLTIPKVCPVLGIPLFWGGKQTDNTPSIDRVIPEKGYVLGNCHIISMRANRLKNNATVDDLKAILEYVTGHSGEKLQ